MSALDALILGGGPAGCAAATLLARWGHRVTLVTRLSAPHHLLGESIPPSTRKLFDLLGLTHRMDAAGFIRATGNTVWWGSDTPRIEYFSDGERGWQVSASALELLLRDAAAAAGARIEIARVDADYARTGRARFVLDCSGRAGVVARARRLRVAERHRTVALVGLWQGGAFETPDPTHTLIDSYDGGWAWSVPRSSTERFVAIMVDPRVSNLARDAASRDVYQAELDKATHMSRILKGAALIDGPRGWDASMYFARRYVDRNVLLVGDAGSFIDPLSSAGIKKALASGWLAAIAVHTSLVRPDMRHTALEFFAARERDVYAAFRGLTERYWRNAAGAHAHPFWTDRAGDAEVVDDTPALTAAFDMLRAAPALSVTLSADVSIALRPAVSGNEIVLEHRLVRTAHEQGVRFAYDVDLVTLIELAPSCRSVPELFDAYNRQAPPVALPNVLTALAFAIAHRWLRWCDT